MNNPDEVRTQLNQVAEEAERLELGLRMEGYTEDWIEGYPDWLKMTRAQRKDFVSFQHATGLTEALQDALLLESEENEQGCLNYYTIPPANDPYRPTPSLDGPSGFPVNIPEGTECGCIKGIQVCDYHFSFNSNHKIAYAYIQQEG